MADATAPMADACAASPTGMIGLRIGAIFVILATSLFGTFFPVLSKRIPTLQRRVPGIVFEIAKFFGSGVILATGFIHLLEPAADEALGPANLISAGGCLPDAWGEYPYAFGICLTSLFAVFVLQLVLFRLGTERLAKLGITDGARDTPSVTEALTAPSPTQEEMHQQAPLVGQHSIVAAPSAAAVHNQACLAPDLEKADLSSDLGSTSDDGLTWRDASEETPAAAQILGVAILEFGVMFHSLIIGLTLAVTDDAEFATLFVVIIFHQMFEGLGLGTRLAFLRLPEKLRWLPYLGAASYSLMTPVGMSIGLGLRNGLNMSGATASIASGVLDSISAGILIYTATVELIAHEFIFNESYKTCSWGRLWFSVGMFALGAGIMALLGKWA